MQQWWHQGWMNRAASQFQPVPQTLQDLLEHGTHPHESVSIPIHPQHFPEKKKRRRKQKTREQYFFFLKTLKKNAYRKPWTQFSLPLFLEVVWEGGGMEKGKSNSFEIRVFFYYFIFNQFQIFFITGEICTVFLQSAH